MSRLLGSYGPWARIWERRHRRVHARAREKLKVFSLVDCLSIGVGRMQRDFGLMRYHVECRNQLKAIFRLLLRRVP